MLQNISKCGYFSDNNLIMLIKIINELSEKFHIRGPWLG